MADILSDTFLLQVNLVLSITIVLINLWGYRKINRATPLILGLAYFLFSLSHSMSIICITDQVVLATVRIPGYIFVTIGLFTIIRDIAELQETQRALRESEERSRAIFEQAAVGMAVVGPSGIIQSTNLRFTEILGYQPQALVSTSVRELDPGWNPMLTDLVEGGCRSGTGGCSGEIRMRRMNGSTIWVQAFISSIQDSGSDGRRSFVVIEDIAGRKQAEEALANLNSGLEQRVAQRTDDLRSSNEALREEIGKRSRTEDLLRHSLEEKEVLIKEVHHRVKNNLQIIISLLYLQSKKTIDPASADALMDSQTRVKSMALIHEKLYQSADLASIDFEGYLTNLVKNLMSAYGVDNSRIRVVTEVKGLPLTINTAISLGLIMNEMISNSLKYAFPNNRPGEIAIRGEQKDKRMIFTVSDNGIGIPREVDWKKTDSLGLNLVQILTRQLKGTVELTRCNGTEFQLSIPV